MATLAVILGLLAVECIGHVAVVVHREGDGGRRGERDAFVGRPEDHVELDAGAGNGRRVTPAQDGRRLAVAEQSGVEEVGAFAAGFQLEMAEAQRLARQGEVDERQLV